ncbi:lectin-like protein [Caulobacter endophyticus]|uniref:Uncharacterized protein n=1 Tax=Caulobacter endophyticus TaxID=2172652 RepID=A0A2T9KE14_9CAUL|nr:lectin-like protein [Caulobacter endophyticus]PVM94188.1 hypothetical protein DDF67_00240 [Caulobacter endophyticus]
MASRIINWVQVGRLIGWEEAKLLASKAGGSLLKEDSSPSSRFLARLAEAGPSDSAHETPSWTGAHKNGVGWVWMDGSPVSAEKLRDESNSDADPGNDSAYVAAVGPFLADPYEDVSAFLMEYSGSRVEGTTFSDWFSLGGAAPGVTILMGDGDDFYSDYNEGLASAPSGGGLIDAGAGDDYVLSSSLVFTTAFDGDGRDDITLANGVIKAAIDGDEDWLTTFQGRVSYEHASEGLTTSAGPFGAVTVSSRASGRDIVSTRELIGGSGDDVLSGVERLSGGGGNDKLTPLAYAAGGRGDDILVAEAGRKVVLLGDAGADTFIFRGQAEATGGAGGDLFVFSTGGFARINDLTAGDKLDMSALFNATVGDPLAEGFLRVTCTNGYTQIAIDSDGGGDEFVAIASIKGAFSDLSGFWLL